MSTPKKLDKGGWMEEALRGYFLELGYFVVRGIPFRYQNFDITDIDLWLYLRPSTLTRERVNVDVKNRRTPQAIERIFWAKGLQQVLGLEKCMVATNDLRPAVIEFGQMHDVIVIDGTFFSRLAKYRNNSERLTEDEFFFFLENDNKSKIKNDLRRRALISKSLLLSQLDFSGCNFWLQEAGSFAHLSIIESHRREAYCRLLYLNIAYFLIGLDYVYKDLAFFEAEARAEALRDGFRHGALGKVGMDRILQTSLSLIEHYLPNGRDLGFTLKKNVSEVFEQVQVDILKEFFNRPDVMRTLFNNASRFEQLAYQSSFTSPELLSPELLSVIGVILDFSEIERKRFFEAFPAEQVKLSL